MPRGAVVTLPPMIRMILTWLRGQFDAGLRAPFGGEIYRADAKAEGELMVLGGWEISHSLGSTR